jgi:hypothetical protein
VSNSAQATESLSINRLRKNIRCAAILDGEPLVEHFLKASQKDLSEEERLWMNWEVLADLWGPTTTPKDRPVLASRVSRRIEIVGSPEKDSLIQLNVREGEKVLKSFSIPWDSPNYAFLKKLRERPLTHSFQLSDQNIATLAKPIQNYVNHLKALSEMLEARFAGLLLSGEIKPTGHNLEVYLRYREIREVLIGERPANRLSDYLWGFLKLPEDILIGTIPGLKKFKYELRGLVRSTWISADRTLSPADAVDFATAQMLRQLSSRPRGHFASVPFGLSVNLESDEFPVFLNFLNFSDMRNAVTLSSENSLGIWQDAHTKLQTYISKVYEKDLSLDPSVTKRLNAFTSSNQDRMSYFFFSDRPLMGDAFSAETKNSEQYSIKGSFGVVVSSKKSDPLSMESYAGINLNRRDGEKVAELTRFGVDGDLRPYGPKTLWQLSAYLMDFEKVDRVVAITNESYAIELMDRFGFEKISQKTNTAGKSEYVLEITSEKFTKRSLFRGN